MGQEESLEKHRFLVQAKSISNYDYEKISAMPINSRTDEVKKYTIF